MSWDQEDRTFAQDRERADKQAIEGYGHPEMTAADLAAAAEVLHDEAHERLRAGKMKLEQLLDRCFRDGNWPSTVKQQEDVRHRVLEALWTLTHPGGEG